MFDDLLSIFTAVKVAGIPMLAVLIGLVQVFKIQLGTQGKATRWLSMATGVLLGFGYWISANGVPTLFSGWFAAFIFGLALGLVGFGLYDASAEATSKTPSK